MVVSNFAFGRNILLDQNEFESAAAELHSLSEDLSRLEKRIRGLLEELKIGFDSPAGVKFFTACTERLLKPMQDQAQVIDHVSQNLRDARTRYQSVFDEYQSLNNAVENG